jgi:DNA-binding XRE family transcriptional regulator
LSKDVPTAESRAGDDTQRADAEQFISQWTDGDAAGLNHNYIGMIERDERNPAIVDVVKIAKALGVPPSELFRDFR